MEYKKFPNFYSPCVFLEKSKIGSFPSEKKKTTPGTKRSDETERHLENRCASVCAGITRKCVQ